jgi:hypothetical protein
MATYYLYENGKQKGPFSFEDLKRRLITTDTAVWKEGMTEWSEAGKVEELVSILVKTPPAYLNNTTNERRSYNNLSAISEAGEKDRRPGKYFTWIGIIAAAILVIAYLNIDTDNPGPAYKSNPEFGFSKQKPPVDSRAGLLQKERKSPKSYISNNSIWRKNLIGETVLEGTLNNLAKTADFKDIVLEVQWLSKTNTVIERKQLIANEFVGAGKSVKYKLKYSGPSRFGNVQVSVVSATPAD